MYLKFITVFITIIFSVFTVNSDDSSEEIRPSRPRVNPPLQPPLQPPYYPGPYYPGQPPYYPGQPPYYPGQHPYNPNQPPINPWQPPFNPGYSPYNPDQLPEYKNTCPRVSPVQNYNVQMISRHRWYLVAHTGFFPIECLNLGVVMHQPNFIHRIGIKKYDSIFSGKKINDKLPFTMRNPGVYALNNDNGYLQEYIVIAVNYDYYELLYTCDPQTSDEALLIFVREDRMRNRNYALEYAKEALRKLQILWNHFRLTNFDNCPSYPKRTK